MAYEAYIITTDYTELYKGAPIDDASFDRIALRASDEIDTLTFGRIRRAGLDSFDAKTQEAVKLATCAMAEALAQIDAETDGTGIVSTSEKVGGFSYTVDTASINALKVEAIKKARSLLWNTGLQYAGISP
jgi:hypothetical protein